MNTSSVCMCVCGSSAKHAAHSALYCCECKTTAYINDIIIIICVCLYVCLSVGRSVVFQLTSRLYSALYRLHDVCSLLAAISCWWKEALSLRC